MCVCVCEGEGEGEGEGVWGVCVRVCMGGDECMCGREGQCECVSVGVGL